MRKLIFAFIFLFFGYVNAQNLLKAYSVSESDGAVSITLEFSEKCPQYRHFTLSNPPRIVIDLVDVSYALSGKVFTVGKGGVIRMRGAQFQKEPEVIARIVLDVDTFRNYSITEGANSLTISVSGISGSAYRSESSEITVSKSADTTLKEDKKYRLEIGEKYFYSPRGKKDPFKPEIGEGEEELLNVSEAKLIGIIKGEEGNIALLQDRRGVGYVLKEGDRVRNGRVVKIESDRVIFATVDFGFTRRIELKLEEEKK